MERSFDLVELMKNFRSALVNFTSTCIFAMLCAFWFFYFQTLPLIKNDAFLFYVFMISIPFSFAVHYFLNQVFDPKKPLLRSVLSIGISGLFAVLLFYCFKDIATNKVYFLEVLLNLSLVCHLLTTLAFWKSNQNSFWQYNHAMMVQFIYATFVASIVGGGVSLALVMIETFFGLKGNLDAYIFQYAFSSAVMTHVFVFLSSLPTKEKIAELGVEYPKYLRYTVQYVFFPIGTLYFVILSSHILYSLLVNGSLPHGQTATFISVIGVVAVLIFLLSYPMDLNQSKSYFKKIVTGLNVWLILLGLVAIAAAVQRIQYVGLTEQRGYLLVLSIWVTVISIWRLVGVGFSIRWVPLTLCVVVFFAGFTGPIAISRLSIDSQQSRLQTLFEKQDLTMDEIKSAESILKYLKNRDAVFINEVALLNKIQTEKEKLAFSNPNQVIYDRKLYFSLENDTEFQVAPLKKFIRLDSAKFLSSGNMWKIEDTKIILKQSDHVGIRESCGIDLLPEVRKWQRPGFVMDSADYMRFNIKCSGKNIVIQFTDLAIDFDSNFNKYKINNFRSYIFY